MAMERFGKYWLLEQLASSDVASNHFARPVEGGGAKNGLVVKRLQPSAATNPEYVKAFTEAAERWANWESSGVASLVDFGTEEKTHYLVHVYWPGFSLKNLARRQTVKRRLLPHGAALHIAGQLASILAQAEKHGAHGCLTPGDVIVGFDGELGVLNFGRGRYYGELKKAGGTVPKDKAQYLAPEVSQGTSPTAQSDLFSLGIILFELLVGQRPKKDTADEAGGFPNAHPSQARPSVPAEVDALVAAMLAADPGARPNSAAEVGQQLQTAAEKDGEEIFDQSSLAALMASTYPNEILLEQQRQARKLTDQNEGEASALPPDHELPGEKTAVVSDPGRNINTFSDKTDPDPHADGTSGRYDPSVKTDQIQKDFAQASASSGSSKRSFIWVGLALLGVFAAGLWFLLRDPTNTSVTKTPEEQQQLEQGNTAANRSLPSGQTGGPSSDRQASEKSLAGASADPSATKDEAGSAGRAEPSTSAGAVASADRLASPETSLGQEPSLEHETNDQAKPGSGSPVDDPSLAVQNQPSTHPQKGRRTSAAVRKGRRQNTGSGRRRGQQGSALQPSSRVKKSGSESRGETDEPGAEKVSSETKPLGSSEGKEKIAASTEASAEPDKDVAQEHRNAAAARSKDAKAPGWSKSASTPSPEPAPKAAPGYLAIVTSTPLDVEVDGWQTSVMGKQIAIKLAPGPHQLTVTFKQSGKSFSRKITIRSGKTKRLRLVHGK